MLQVTGAAHATKDQAADVAAAGHAKAKGAADATYDATVGSASAVGLSHLDMSIGVPVRGSFVTCLEAGRAGRLFSQLSNESSKYLTVLKVVKYGESVL